MLAPGLEGKKQPTPLLPFSLQTLSPAKPPLGGLPVPLTLPKNVPGQRRGVQRARPALPPAWLQEPQCLPEKGSRGRDVTFAFRPGPSLPRGVALISIQGRGVFPSSFQPSSLSVAHIRMEFTLSCLAVGLWLLWPWDPLHPTWSILDAKTGGGQVGPLPRGWKCVSFCPTCGSAFSEAGARRWAAFFRTPFSVCFHAMVAFLFSVNESAFN